MNPAVALAVGLTGIGSAAWSRPRIARYVADVTRCGSIRPISKAACRRATRIARVLAFVQVGRIRVRGAEHLPQHGPAIIAPNHPHYADAAVVPLVINSPVRYLVARGVLRFCRGLGALVLGATGVVCVDLRPRQGIPALRAAIRLLRDRERLVIFPEGWAHMDGRPGQFKRGVAYIAREAARTSEEPVHIVPVFLRYGRYPGARIKRFGPRLQYLMVLLGFWYFRRGVTVVVGEPFAATTMPDDLSEATRMLEQRILSLDPAAS